MNEKDIINNVYNYMRSVGRKIYKKEIKQYLECYDKQDYSPMWSTDLYVNLPDIDTDYNYDRYTYNIGYWMYNQIRLRKFGLLSSDRINKLRNIPVIKKTKLKTYDTTINAFDRDSYVQGIYDSICNIDKTNILFRFNSNGELDNNGTEILYLVDKSEIKLTKFNFSGNSYYGKVNDDSQTFPENFIVFKKDEKLGKKFSILNILEQCKENVYKGLL